jgi:long-chain acyl-CoA synthetase
MATRASAATVSEQFVATATARATDVAIRTRDASVTWTWADYAASAGRAASALGALGLRRGDTVGVWLRNRPEFHVADAGAMLLGAIPASIYTTATDAHATHVIRDSGCRVLITEPVFLGSALTIRNAGTTSLETIVLVDGEGPGAVAWSDLVARADPDFDVAAASSRAQPEDVLALVYTAGTAGAPKGVEITHANMAAQLAAVIERIGLAEGLRVVSSMPMATIAERLCGQYLPMRLGWEVTCCPDPALIDVFLREVRPGFFFAAPRTWEALKASVMARIDTAEGLRALEASLQRVHLVRARRPVPAELDEACAAADAAFFTPLRARLGLDQVRTALIGAAHCPLDVTAFFHAIGIPVAELYGLSEATGVVSTTAGTDGRIGNVGLPLPGCELRLSDEGELLIRAPFVAQRYHDGPAGHRPVTDADGWFATGDIATIDDTGTLQILDRVDALIRSGAGETVSPAKVEAALRRASPLVGHACIAGADRPYAVALLTLDGEGARQWARDHDLRGSDLGVLADHPHLLGAVADGVARANATLDEHEHVRRFLLLGADWKPGGDELTQTLKLKRGTIAHKYAPEIDALYDGDGVEPARL